MRLIDADALLNDMKIQLEALSEEVENEQIDKDELKVILTSAIALKDFVAMQPTIEVEPIEHHDETFRDRLKREHPECVSARYQGGCRLCPSHYGYEPYEDRLCNRTNGETDAKQCTECWNRKIEKI